MLHTKKYDAFARLIERAGRRPTRDEVTQMQAHMRGYLDEIERYRSHEDLFRHVLRSPNIDGTPKEEQIRHTGERVLSILDLEARVDARTAEEFREFYVNEAVRRLFGSSVTDLVGSANQGIQLPIPEDVMKRYAQEHRIDLGLVKSVARKKILGTSQFYGYRVFYLEPTIKNDEKGILTDLIELAVGLPYQSKDSKVRFPRESDLSLQKVADHDVALIDDLISFSAYDPMRTPRPEAQTHTLVFQSLKDSRSPNVEPRSKNDVKKVIEGNGGH